MKRLSVILIPMLLALLTSHAVHATAPPHAAAAAGAQAWLRLIDEGNYGESWKTAAGFFRANVSEANWTASLQGVRAPLGAPIHRQYSKGDQTTRLPGAPDGDYCIMIFTTDFTHKKAATETLTFMLDQDGQWRAAGYFIK